MAARSPRRQEAFASWRRGVAATVLIAVSAAFFLTSAARLRAFSAQRSVDLANAALSASERGDIDSAARFALAGIMGADMPVFGFDASAAEAELRRALAAGPFRYAVGDGGAVAFSPNGARIVTGHGSGEAVVGDARTGRAIARLPETHGLPTSVLSPDWQAVLTFDESSSARIWDPATGREMAALRGHRGAIVKASLDRTGRRVLTVSTDGGGEQIIPNRDGPLIALTSHVGGVQLWSAASPSRLEILPGALCEFGFSDDGSRLFTASARQTRVWDVASRELLADIATASDVAPAFGPGGRHIVTASRDQAEAWDGASGAEVARPRVDGAGVAALGFDEAGARALVVHNDGRAEVLGIGGDRRTLHHRCRLRPRGYRSGTSCAEATSSWPRTATCARRQRLAPAATH